MKATPTIEKGLGTLIITGSSGRIGSSFIDRVGESYSEMGFDREGPPHPPPETEHVIACDLSSDESVRAALDEVRRSGTGGSPQSSISQRTIVSQVSQVPCMSK